MIERRPGDGGMETVVLSTKSGELVEVVPERGAIVTRYRSKGEEVLFLDPATLADRSKNVRGGVPVLFPIAGKLPDGRYTWEGKTYALPQHGFARNKPWRVLAADESGGGPSLRLGLSSDEATRAVYPFDFEATLSVRLDDADLAISLEVANRGIAAMPVHSGFHPYFSVPDSAKKDARVPTKATRGFDNRTGQAVTVGALDFTIDELDLRLEDHGRRDARLERGPGRRELQISWSETGNRVVLWTVRGKDYICVEPWTGPGGALATNDPTLIRLAPGETTRLSMRIAPA